MMRTRAVLAFLCMALSTASCSARNGTSDEGAPVGAHPSNPLFGVWKVESAQAAPWRDGASTEPRPNSDLLNASIDIEADKSSGPEFIACDDPAYTTSFVSPQGLFEGKLPQAATEARTFGFTDDEITTVNLRCKSRDAGVRLDFAIVDQTTAMLGLDDMIYTLKRTSS